MRHINSQRSSTIVLLLFIAATSLSQSVADVRELELGKPIERELAGGETHAYTISLTTGQFLHVIVDQRGIDVVVNLFAPDGKLLMEVDSPNGTNGPEPIMLVAKTAGDHRLEVRSLEKKAVAGRYELKIEALRVATAKEKLESEAKDLARVLTSAKSDEERATILAQEKQLVTVELVRALYQHARDFRNQRKFPQALVISRLGVGLAEQIGDQMGVGDFLYNIGYVLYWQRDSAQALEYLEKSFRLRTQLGEKLKAGDALNVIGSVYNNQLNNTTQALEYYRKSLALYQETGNEQGEIGTWNNIGLALRNQGNPDRALEAFHKALSVNGETGSKNVRAQLFFEIGATNFFQGNNAEALKHYQESLRLREVLGDKSDIALTLNRIGLAQRLLGNYPQALAAAQRSTQLSELVDNKGLMSDAIMTLGLVHQAQGNITQALEAYKKSLRFAEEAKAKQLIANAFEKIGGIYHSQGRIELALEHFHNSLKLVEELGNKRQIIFTTNAIAGVHTSQGNYSQALEYFQKSLKLSEEVGNKFQIANALNSIGIVYSYQGDYRQALDYYRRAWTLREETGEARGVQSSINNVGTVYALQGNYAQALEYFQKTLTLSEKIGNKGGARTALNNIGEMYLMLGDYPKALDASRRSLAMSEELGNKLAFPETMNIIANIYLSQGDYSKALEMTERAAAIAGQTGDRAHLWHARATAGKAYRALNQPDKALHAFEEAVTTIESLRTNFAGQAARASYFASVQKPYEFYIDLLMQLHKQHPSAGHNAIALQLSESVRARSLLEALSEARADIRQGVDPELLQRERTLQQQLNAAGERQTRLLTDKHTEEQVAKVKKELDALTSEFQDVEGQIRQRSPRYAALTQPAPLSLKGIQTQILDADTLLLEYALGEERSYLWAVTPNSINSFELPKRSEIEVDVRRAIGLLSGGKQWTTNSKVQLEYAEVAGRLSQMLLGPVVGQLKGKRLLIVGDGALQYLPFGALPSPFESVAEMSARSSRRTRINRVSTSKVRLPLTVEHEIVSLPSASTLAILRRETANRKQSAKSVAVLADPVFERDDERLRAVGTMTVGSELPTPAKSTSQASSPRLLLERAFGLGLSPSANVSEVREILRIPRLPFTRREASAILGTVAIGEGMQALDFQASRTTAMNPDLAQYRIVHFATHGLLNSEHPELSGIVLSLLNDKGEPVNGFLRLHEIYNLNLPAELVVLSACQTGLGKEIRGEGLVGLTRGFMYAGAPRVVASLWKVDDAATAELMKRFYAGMLKDNLRPAAALRRAKIEMWKQPRWQAPFYWAAFELQGEWK